MASDGSKADRSARSRGMENGFTWVSSSPSPAEVASLEARFPEVVRIPESELQEEMAGWLHSAVLARSFSKWVPIDAYLREFRRAGVSGAIVPVSLAFRCCIFRFEDPAAREMVLNRPWIINGQIIATEAWHPDFFPAKNSVSSALVWLRLPNLPMEYWKVESLRAIVDQAGVFFGADEATLAKNRGCFARVAVRVDLCCPLRPGTRVQGLRGPFWQQFAYEALDGFCQFCGSLHLEGPCSEEDLERNGGPGGSSGFGPWLAAVRQRRIPVAPSGKPAPSQGKPSSSVSVPEPASPSVAVDPDLKGGWQVPSKRGRRRLPGLVQPVPGQQASVEGMAGGSKGSAKGKEGQVKAAGKQSSPQLVAVPVFQSRAGFKLSESGNLMFQGDGSSETAKSQAMASINPFASLELISNDAGQEMLSVKGSGPLKRARPADNMASRSIPKVDRRKDKGKGKIRNGLQDLIPSPHVLPTAPSGLVSDVEEVMGDSVGRVDHVSEPSFSTIQGRGSLTRSDETEVLHDCTTLIGGDRLGAAGHQMDSLMIEDQGAVPTTSN